jgi:hypothetical protein
MGIAVAPDITAFSASPDNAVQYLLLFVVRVVLLRHIGTPLDHLCGLADAVTEMILVCLVRWILAAVILSRVDGNAISKDFCTR